ncbi:hypothetical protein GF327_06000 [Candidatus Woesearchaeota archaeon]|nr:hypothetical protein [Candidatus Woesearchaeota archaeon]
MFFCDNYPDGPDLFKIIDKIEIDKKITEHKNHFCFFEKKFDTGCINYLLHNNNLLIDVNNNCSLNLFLDMRKIHDFDDKGRIYELKKKDNKIIIHYKKYKDDSLKTLLYKRFCVLKTKSDVILKNNWKEVFYKKDKQRNSLINKLWVYHGLQLDIKNNERIVFSYSDKLDEAIKNADDTYHRFDSIFNKEIVFSNNHYDLSLKGKEISFAYLCAKKSLNDLYCNINQTKGILAGFPWFFQVWARDEAISLGAYIRQLRLHSVKNILNRQLNNFRYDGRIHNRFPYSGLASADSSGWMFFRLYEFLVVLKQHNLLSDLYTLKDIEIFDHKLDFSIHQHIKYYLEDNLITNFKLETWMDTHHKTDTREGQRIEIQALFLAMLKLSVFLKTELKKDTRYHEKILDDVKEAVITHFFTGKILKDGKNDDTIRPNIFIANYVFPDLLKKKDWTKVFVNSLDKLWLSWGGLSSIQKDSELFCSVYTGENNQSYHRGDSWFWVNNLAAICLHKTDKKLFKKFIEKIVSASTRDILYCGAIGNHSEISSASKQTADGCLSQAWSNAMYIEMIKEIFNH